MHSKTTHKNKSTLDLNKVRDILFEDIYKLLDSFNLEYTQEADNIFMKCPIQTSIERFTKLQEKLIFRKPIRL